MGKRPKQIPQQKRSARLVAIEKSEQGNAGGQKQNEAIKRQITNRLWRGLNYLTINLFWLFVYGSSIIVDYLLFSLIWWLLADEISQSPFLAALVRYTQIGLAIMAVFAAIVHGVYSTWGQIQMDVSFSREGEGHHETR